jgi:hypothetical protein
MEKRRRGRRLEVAVEGHEVLDLEVCVVPVLCLRHTILRGAELAELPSLLLPHKIELSFRVAMFILGAMDRGRRGLALLPLLRSVPSLPAQHSCVSSTQHPQDTHIWRSLLTLPASILTLPAARFRACASFHILRCSLVMLCRFCRPKASQF